MDVDYNDMRSYKADGYAYGTSSRFADNRGDMSRVSQSQAQTTYGRREVVAQDSWQEDPQETWRGAYLEGEVPAAPQPTNQVVWGPPNPMFQPAAIKPLDVRKTVDQARAAAAPPSQIPRRSDQYKLGQAPPKVPVARDTSNPRAMLPRISLPVALNPNRAMTPRKRQSIPTCWYGVPFIESLLLQYAKNKHMVVSSSAGTADVQKTWKRVKGWLGDQHDVSVGLKDVHSLQVPLLAFFSNENAVGKVTKERVIRIKLLMKELGYGRDYPMMWYLDKREMV